jgi:hypothetical protein
MSAQERREQGLSFIVGSGAVEGTPIHRGTVSVAVPTLVAAHVGTTVAAGMARTSSVVPFDVDGVLRQFNLVRSLVDRHVAGSPVEITPDLIRSLHAVVGAKGPIEFGVFRSLEVEVHGSLHRPIAPDQVAGAVLDLCRHLKARWDLDDAVSLSAFALWALNWIHPFLDGNGRVARALSYLVLNLKLGLWLPGSPTLVEQLYERRAEYFDALAAADLDVRNGAAPDLSDLRKLLGDLLVRQLRSLPALSSREEADLQKIFERRIAQLKPPARQQVFGAAHLALRAWSIGDYLLFHVAGPDVIKQAEELFAKSGTPFPGLLASPGERSILAIDASQRGAVVRPREFEVEEGGALWLAPNAAVVVDQPAIASRKTNRSTPRWQLGGVLYVLRRGDEITDLWVLDLLDLLIARHVQEAL